MSRARSLTARLVISALVSALVLVGAGASARAASGLDPILRFRTIATEHFILYFHQGEDRLAVRLAAIAEETWQALGVPLGRTPPRLTHVVLLDQTDLANGLATPLPYDTIVVTAVWPAGWEFIGNTNDWLRLAFTHEFTHIVHLDRSEGWARWARRLFGRTPFAFPNLFLPGWQIEGIATYEESAITGTGRMHAGDFRAIVGEAARVGRLEPLDRTNGGLTDWPGGAAVYAYGLGFHAYLAERFGADRLAALADATARRVPFTSARAFDRVYGQSLGSLWRDYESSLKAPAPPGPDDGARRLTHHGFTVVGPRFARPACDTCPAEIVYSLETPHEFPALYRVALNGSAPARLASRYLGATTAIDRDTIYFDQLEQHRNAGLYGDLYALDRASGHVERLTSEARLLDPDLSPDHTTLVCVQATRGQRNLVLVPVISGFSQTSSSPAVAQAFRPAVNGPITTLISEPETQFNTPRWSPDGRTIAVERHVPGRQSEIVLVDVATRRVRAIASDPTTRFVTPVWRPDGQAIVAAADVEEGPFNLYELAIDVPAVFAATQPPQPARRTLTHTTGGAMWPDVAPDGKTIVFAGYTTDGFDLFEMPYPTTATPDPNISTANVFNVRRADLIRSAETQPFRSAVNDAVAFAPYNPTHTLAPTSWSPIIEGDRHQLRLGLATGGVDVLGYHAYTVSATWLATSSTGAPTPSSATPDWQVYYQYARWRPTVWVSASTATSFFAGPPGEDGVASTSTLRERQVEAGVLFPIRHVRIAQRTISSIISAVDDFTLPDGVISRNRTAWRGGWAIDSSHMYGYSISPDNGVALGITADLPRRALGSSADASTVTADGRVYVSPFARHQVLAVRLAGGISNGDATLRRTFHLGGVEPNVDVLDFGRNAISLLRGFPGDTFAGSHVALVNADYRWPIARPQRGHGTWPLFLHTIHAAVFADVGHAWTRTFDVRNVKTSTGGELSFNVIAGYSIPLTAAIGAAWGRDGSGAIASGTSIYVRIGRAF